MTRERRVRGQISHFPTSPKPGVIRDTHELGYVLRGLWLFSDVGVWVESVVLGDE